MLENRVVPVKERSQRARWGTIAGLLAAIVFLIWWGYRISPVMTLARCYSDPSRYDGKEVVLGLDTRVHSFAPEGFILSQIDRTIPVKGDPGNAAVGDFVQIKGVFHEEGFLELKELYVAKRRRHKVVVSIFPALLVLVLLFRTYKFDGEQWAIKERN